MSTRSQQARGPAPLVTGRSSTRWSRVETDDQSIANNSVQSLIRSRTWRETWAGIRSALTGDEGASYVMSVVVHLLLLAVLAVPVAQELHDRPVVTTLLPSVEEASVVLNSPVPTEFELPPGNPQAGMLASTEIDSNSSIPTVDLNLDSHGAGAPEGEEGGTGGKGDALGGGMLGQPGNAVVAGSFAVWHVPIQGKIGSSPILGNPGDAPRRYQDYFIVIQVRLPKGKKAYRLSDLSGRVVGTDGYEQPIPARANMQLPDHRVVRASPWRDLKPTSGVIQIMIEVPGAEAFVQDTINIHSKLLDEDQELVLTFQAKF